MNFFKNIFHSEKLSSLHQEYFEKDNIGTRLKSAIQADGFWQVKYLLNTTGSVNYTFNNLDEAKKSLSQLSFIHVANDSGELISTEIIEYGYYEREGKGVVVIWGDSFTDELWNEANDKLSKAGGIKLVSQRPVVKRKEKLEKVNRAQVNDIKYIKLKTSSVATYEYYSGSSKSSALEFLKQKSVNKQFYHIVVETPEGIYARDIQGIYEG